MRPGSRQTDGCFIQLCICEHNVERAARTVRLSRLSPRYMVTKIGWTALHGLFSLSFISILQGPFPVWYASNHRMPPG